MPISMQQFQSICQDRYPDAKIEIGKTMACHSKNGLNYIVAVPYSV